MGDRFPLLTDENVPGPLIEALRACGWDVVRVIDVFGERSVDDVVFAHAEQHGRTLVSTDTDCLAIGNRWLAEGRAFRLIFWRQGLHQRTRPAGLVSGFEKLASNRDAFAYGIEYLHVEN